MEESSTILLHYGGAWRTSRNTLEHKYVREKELTFTVDQDYINLMDLIDYIYDETTTDKEVPLRVCYKRPGEKVEYTTIFTDQDVMKMFDVCKSEKIITMYANRKETLDTAAASLRDQPPALDNIANITNIAETDVVDFLGDNDVEFHTSSSEDPSNPSEDNDDDDDSDIPEKVVDEDISSSDDDAEQFQVHTYERQPVDSSLQIGSMYENAQVFREALSDYAIKHHFQTIYIANDKRRVTVKCANEQCVWRLHASTVHGGTIIQVKTVKGEHNCEAVNICGNRMATSKWICNKIVDWIRVDPGITTKAIRARLKDSYQVELGYWRVWKGKELAMEKIYGNIEKSFNLFPALEKELNERNSDSIIRLEVDDLDGSFQRFFVCFKSCIDGFKAGCRPYLGLDGCHLKGKYFGDLLAATAWDGNYGIFPVAFAIVDVETGYSWKWFLECLKMGLGKV